jgi:hypothetical protein
MSFDIYFKIMVDSSQTEIFGNTESIFTDSNNQDMRMIGIDYTLNTTISDTNNNYLELDLPCYTVKRQHSYDFKSNSGETNASRKQMSTDFYNNLTRMASDYIIIIINDFSGYQIDNYLFKTIESLVSLSNLTEDTSEGSWLLLLKNSHNKNKDRGTYQTILDVVDTSQDISKYHMTHSQTASIDKDKWNELFVDNNTTSFITETFQSAFDDMDDLIYDDSSNYVVILSRIHHHLIHENRNLESSSNSDSYNAVFVEVPYYNQSINSGDLTIDREQLRSDMKAFNKIAVAHGLDQLKTQLLPIIKDTFKTDALLNVNLANSMLTARNYYITIRTEFYSKYDLFES